MLRLGSPLELTSEKPTRAEKARPGSVSSGSPAHSESAPVVCEL